MTIKVNFFNNTEYDYYAEDFNRQLNNIVMTNGVSDGGSFGVSPQQTPNGTVNVAGGGAWWNGQFIYSDSTELLTIQPNTTSSDRVDVVVLQMDLINLTASLEVVQSGSITDQMIPICEITMSAQTSIVTADKIKDIRSIAKFNPNLIQEIAKDVILGGTIKGMGQSGHRLWEHTGVFFERNAQMRIGSANNNGYPSLAYIINDLDNDANSNGIVYLLGNGKSGDARQDNYFRPWKQGGGLGKNHLGSSSIPFDELWLSGFSKGNSGYSKLPNGLIIQWGQNTINFNNESGKSLDVTLPISFPTKGVAVSSGCPGMSAWYNYSSNGLINPNYQRTHISLNIKRFDSVLSSESVTVQWFAIGY